VLEVHVGGGAAAFGRDGGAVAAEQDERLVQDAAQGRAAAALGGQLEGTAGAAGAEERRTGVSRHGRACPIRQ
jgi:hypothetical protein